MQNDEWAFNICKYNFSGLNKKLVLLLFSNTFFEYQVCFKYY